MGTKIRKYILSRIKSAGKKESVGKRWRDFSNRQDKDGGIRILFAGYFSSGFFGGIVVAPK